jgi:hypothetical protein
MNGMFGIRVGGGEIRPPFQGSLGRADWVPGALPRARVRSPRWGSEMGNRYGYFSEAPTARPNYSPGQRPGFASEEEI